MHHAIVGGAVILALVAGMAGALLLGRRLGRRRLQHAQDGADGTAGIGALDGVVFALLGLLMAFTYSGASNRFDERRQLIVQEANAIGTAYLRVDLLPPGVQPEIRTLFRRYTRSRLATYRLLPDVAAARASFEESATLQSEIWARATAAAASLPSPAPLLLVTPALNEMFDIASTRVAAFQMHQPGEVFVILYALALAAALLAGHLSGEAPAHWLHAVVFVGAVAAGVFVILDMEFPRVGFIRVDELDAIIEGVLAGMR